MPRLGIRLHGGLAPQRCVELARAAEASGLASMWFAENPLERGALPALAACATATQRVELGIGVGIPFLRHPAQIAMDASALDELSQGRVTLEHIPVRQTHFLPDRGPPARLVFFEQSASRSMSGPGGPRSGKTLERNVLSASAQALPRRSADWASTTRGPWALSGIPSPACAA